MYAAEILDRMMRGESLSDRKYSIEPLGVRKRVSTDVLTVEDRHVAAAIAFIRQNALDIFLLGDGDILPDVFFGSFVKQ